MLRIIFAAQCRQRELFGHRVGKLAVVMQPHDVDAQIQRSGAAGAGVAVAVYGVNLGVEMGLREGFLGRQHIFPVDAGAVIV